MADAALPLTKVLIITETLIINIQNMKPRFQNNTLLSLCVVALLLLCGWSIGSPIWFERQYAGREQEVKRLLVRIRTAEESYRRQHGVYAADFRQLVQAGLLPHDAQYIPHADGKPFALSTTTIIGRSGRHIALMECSAPYEAYLRGLDPDAIARLIEQANASGAYPGLKIGDLTQPNNNAGNWE